MTSKPWPTRSRPASQIAIWAPGRLGPLAVAYAARHPERVAKLVLWSTGPVGADMLTESMRSLAQLGRLDWDLAMESVTAAVGNFEDPQSARDMAVMYRSISPAGRDAYLRFETDVLTWDVTDLLPAVQCPTLVMHPSGSRVIPVTNARRMAAGIPGARLQLIETSSSFTPPDAVRLGFEFLFGPGAHADTATVRDEHGRGPVRRHRELDGTHRTVGRRRHSERGPASSIARCVQSSSALTGGWWRARRSAMACWPRSRPPTTPSPRLGDCAAAGDDAGLPLHLGLHAGDVIREAGNVFGGAVNVAARVSALSEPGEVLVSHTVRDLARTSAGVTFEDRGEHELKGVSDPVRVFAVRGA